MLWTDEADDLLIRLWDEGGSLAYVADGMIKAGYDVSRNAVSGRRHRLPAEAFRRTTPTATNIVRIPSPRQHQRSKTVKVPSRTPITDAEIAFIAKHPGVEYLENDPRGCKAIMPTRGGPWELQRVCGRPRGLDYNGCISSYCPLHYRMFTTPSARKA